MFSITEDPLTWPEAQITAEIDGEDDEWQDVEISEEWGPQTPMTPLNDDDEDTIHPATQRFAVATVRSIYHSSFLILVFEKREMKIFSYFHPI